jgi:hypothetical protein
MAKDTLVDPNLAKGSPNAAPAQGKTINITYTPLDSGDPHTTTWHGHVLEANKPKAVSVKHTAMIASAKLNPWFLVEGFKQAQRRDPTKDPVPFAGSDHPVVDPSKEVDAETADELG